MQERNFEWETSDGIHISGREWQANQPKGAICLIHGLGEHIGRYSHFAQYFTDNGYSVIGYDRRGHGLSGGKRGHTPRVDLLLDEVSQLLVQAKVHHQRMPIFLYGHSMGGNLVLAYALKRHPEVQGVIASAPWIRLAFQPSGIEIALGKIMRILYPAYTQGNGLKTEHLSKDPEVVRAYEQDPLVHDRITAATGIGMMQQANWLDQYSGLFPLPLLIMHGGEDHIVSPEGSRAFALRVQGDVTYREWEGLYHEIHNEKKQLEVFEYAHHWMEHHIEKKSMAAKTV